MSERLFRLFRPAHDLSNDTGLVVLLHGIGSNEEDLFSLAGSIDPRFAVAAIRAPYPYAMGGYAWFSIEWTSTSLIRDVEQGRSSLTWITEEVRLLTEEAGVPPERVVIGGFSQGAIMSLTLLLNQPDLVGGALLMSGAVFPELAPTPRHIGPKPVLVQHGVFDPILNVELGREVKAVLDQFGIEPDYREYRMAHEVSWESLQDARAWLAAFLDRS